MLDAHIAQVEKTIVDGFNEVLKRKAIKGFADVFLHRSLIVNLEIDEDIVFEIDTELEILFRRTDEFGKYYRKKLKLMQYPGHIPSLFTRAKLLISFKRNFNNGFLKECESEIYTRVFQGELDEAKQMLENNHLRSSMLLVGIIAESKIKQLCKVNGIKTKKITSNQMRERLQSIGVLKQTVANDLESIAKYRNMAAHEESFEANQDEIKNKIDLLEIILRQLDVPSPPIAAPVALLPST